VRYARAGRAIRLPGGAGAHRLRLTGRIGGRALRPGRYRLVLRAIETGGARAVTRALGFRILAARARR